MELLCLIRFSASGTDVLPAYEAVELFSAALDDANGRIINSEGLEAMVMFQDPNLALQLLSDTMDAGQREKFCISAGLVQGVHSKAMVASSLSGFTESTMETLFAVTGAAQPQQVAISPRLSSLIELSAPTFAKRFTRANDHSTSDAPALVMQPSSKTTTN